VSAAYNFTNSGAGRYSFEPDTLFNIVNADGSIAPMHADLADAHVAHVDGVLAVPRGHALRRRATYNGCSSSEQTSLKSAASAGNSYASGAASYASAHTASTTRFTTWFGTYTSSRHSTVLSHYTKISSHDMTAYQFDCTCTESDTYAYTYPDECVAF
jgi:peptidyl-Lys metalloendopeptidase